MKCVGRYGRRKMSVEMNFSLSQKHRRHHCGSFDPFRCFPMSLKVLKTDYISFSRKFLRKYTLVLARVVCRKLLLTYGMCSVIARYLSARSSPPLLGAMKLRSRFILVVRGLRMKVLLYACCCWSLM